MIYKIKTQQKKQQKPAIKTNRGIVNSNIYIIDIKI